MLKKTEKKLRVAARRGARKLDKIHPEWYTKKHIKLSTLNLRSPSACVAGQLLQMTTSGRFGSSVPDPVREKFYAEANGGFIEAMKGYDVTYGFDALYESDWETPEFRVLDDEWKKLIRVRRDKARYG